MLSFRRASSIVQTHQTMSLNRKRRTRSPDVFNLRILLLITGFIWWYHQICAQRGVNDSWNVLSVCFLRKAQTTTTINSRHSHTHCRREIVWVEFWVSDICCTELLMRDEATFCFRSFVTYPLVIYTFTFAHSSFTHSFIRYFPSRNLHVYISFKPSFTSNKIPSSIKIFKEWPRGK